MPNCAACPTAKAQCCSPRPPWTQFIAPEILRGGEVSERALVYGVGQIARVLLFGAQPLDGAWTQFAQDVLGKRDAAKNFLSDPAAAKLPGALRAAIAKS